MKSNTTGYENTALGNMSLSSNTTGIKNTDIADELALPPVKIHCSVLAEDAISAAIADIKGKQESSGKWTPK